MYGNCCSHYIYVCKRLVRRSVCSSIGHSASFFQAPCHQCSRTYRRKNRQKRYERQSKILLRCFDCPYCNTVYLRCRCSGIFVDCHAYDSHIKYFQPHQNRYIYHLSFKGFKNAERTEWRCLIK